jgi:hypothetical protein
MKTNISESALILSGVNNKYQIMLNALVLSVFIGVATIVHAQASDTGPAPAANTADSVTTVSPAGDPTNTPVQQIQISLDNIKIEIATAAKAMAEANASTPAQQMEKVKKLAVAIRGIATNELADTAQIAMNADLLIAKMKTELAQAHERASEPNNIDTKQIYDAVADKLGPVLDQTINARASVANIRSQLLKKADSLDQFSLAIGFAESASQDIIAAEAFKKAVKDVAKFAEQIQNMIDSVNKVPIT